MTGKQDLQPLLDTHTNQLNLVFGDSDRVDAKALAVLGANVAILIFIDQASLQLPFWQYLLLYGPFALSLVMDIVSVWPQKYLSAATDLNQSTEYLGLDREDLLLQLLADTQAAIHYNSALNKKRLLTCTLSVILTGLGFLPLLLIL